MVPVFDLPLDQIWVREWSIRRKNPIGLQCSFPSWFPHWNFPIRTSFFLDFFHGHRLGILILHFWQDLRQQVLKTKKELLEAGRAEILWKAWMVGWLPFFFYAWSGLLHPPSGAPSIETRNAHVGQHMWHLWFILSDSIGAKFRTIGWIDLGRHVYVDNALYLSVCLSVCLSILSILIYSYLLSILIYSYLFLSILIYSYLFDSYAILYMYNVKYIWCMKDPATYAWWVAIPDE